VCCGRKEKEDDAAQGTPAHFLYDEEAQGCDTGSWMLQMKWEWYSTGKMIRPGRWMTKHSSPSDRVSPPNRCLTATVLSPSSVSPTSDPLPNSILEKMASGCLSSCPFIYAD